MNNPTLGQKIKFFRTLKNFKQLELELSAGISEGSVSRMETDLINPTKEVLHKIENALNLSAIERIYLGDPKFFDVSNEDTNRVINNFSNDFLNRNYFGYILNPKLQIVAGSLGLEMICNYAGLDFKKFLGVTTLETLIDPKYGIRERIPKEKFEGMVLNHLKREYQEMPFKAIEPWYKEIEGDLKRNFDLAKYLEKLESYTLSPYSKESRRISYIIGDITLDISFNMSPVISDPRFTLIEWDLLEFEEIITSLIANEANI